MTTACPSDDVLAAHLAGALDAAAADALGAHLDGCDACRAVVVAAVRGGVAAGAGAGGAALAIGTGPGAAGDDGADGRADADAPTIAMRRGPRGASAAAGASGRATALLPAGTRVGRYAITRALGAGGMGVVYAAHDTELDREVALKLLRPGAGPIAAAMAERLARESRLMAKVRHPSVLTIYDAGRDGDRVYLAMELVAGGTLAAWLRARPRRWRDVLAVFRRAGLGLAAAHRAGLVHRDVKPENVLVEGGDDDAAPARVLVTDFGVARAVGGDAEAAAAAAAGARDRGAAARDVDDRAAGDRGVDEPAVDDRGAGDRADDDRAVDDRDAGDRADAGREVADGAAAGREVADGAAAERAVAGREVADGAAADRAVAERARVDRAARDRLTATGVAVGTPAYMAPEQLDAGAVDARTDAFGFAIALWEALYGERPFAGATAAELRAAMERGPRAPRADAPGRALGRPPAWLERALRRALAVAPAARPASMDALLAAIDPAPRARRRVLAGAAAAVALAAAGVIAFARGGAPAADPSAACAARTADLDAAWSPPARARARARLATATGAAAAESGPTRADDADAVLAFAERRAGELRAAVAEVCREDAATTPAYAARLACLDARRLEQLAFAEGLADGTPDAVTAAREAVMALEAPKDCLGDRPPRLEPLVPADAAARRAVQALRNRMIVIDQEREAGRFEAARAAADALADQVRAAAFAPLDAEYALLRGSIAHEGLDSAHAAEALLAAATTAERAHHDYVAAAAWVQLVQVAALDQRDAARGREYVAQGQAALDRLGGDLVLGVQLEYGRIEVLVLDGKYGEARDAFERLRARAARDAPDQLLVIATGIAALYEDLGRYDDAIAAYLAALPSARAPGAAATAEGMIHGRLANVWVDRGVAPLAVAEAAMSRASYAVLGPDHVDRVTTELTWSSALITAGRYDEARRAAEGAEARLRAIYGGKNPAIADALEDEGDALVGEGRAAEGAARIARACAILGFSGGDDSATAAECRVDLAGARAEAGPAAAAAEVDGAEADLALLEGAYGEGHPIVAQARAGLGHLEAIAGRADEARDDLTAALPELAAARVDPGYRGRAQLDLARVAATPAERRRWARAALAELAIASPSFADDVRAARAMLR